MFVSQNDKIEDFTEKSFLLLDSDKDWFFSQSSREQLFKNQYHEVDYTLFLDDGRSTTDNLAKVPAVKFITSIKSDI